MNPLVVLAWLKDNWLLVVVLGLVAFAGVQTYRLRGAQADRDLLQLEKTERIRRDAMREAQNEKNKERTDEEHAAARSRAAAVVVRGEPGAGISGGKGIRLAPSGEGAPVCFDRRHLDEELAGWVERHAQGLTDAVAAISRAGDGRLTAVARSGEDLAAGFRACRSWALNLQ